jgi:ParB family chromosome partitioning protein
MSNVDEGKKSAMHGLGRGLDALIPTNDPFEEEAPAKANGLITVELIDPNPKQPRMEFDEVALAELAASIREHGVLQPLLVCPEGERYQLIAGERRLRAAKIAGLKEVPVIERTLDEQSKLELAVIENVQRADLNPIEIAASFRKLMDEFNLTQEDIAKKVGKARSTVANMLRLLSLPMEIKRAIAEGKISEGHARTLLNITDQEEQMAFFHKIIENKLSVREAEKRTSISKVSKDKPAKSQDFLKAEDELGRALATKVEIKAKKRGGQVVIDYYSKEDLDRIYQKITE